jgi:hypothetical protein
MMLVCPTLRTAAVGVTRAGRHDGGRRLAGGNGMSVQIPGGSLPPLRCRKEDIRSVPRFGLELGAFVSLFRLFVQWLGYCCACQPEVPIIACQST